MYDGAFGGAVGWPAAGMGYVIRTNDGAIVIDGGLPEDAEPLLELIGDEPIRLWVITHPHYDHYGALHTIAKSHTMRKRVRVERLCYYFPADLLSADGHHVCADAKKHMTEIAEALGSDVHRPSYLEKLCIGETELCFIYTPDDCTIFKSVPPAQRMYWYRLGNKPKTSCRDIYGQRTACPPPIVPLHSFPSCNKPD